jgi:RNA polymerase sigma factor (sigma-70 family)
MLAQKALSAPDQSDADLVRASLAGDRDAFGHIVVRYQSLVCSLAYRATGSIARSEDLAQDTFLSAWRNLPALREPARLRSWLCGIVRNLVNNSLRRAERELVQVAAVLEPSHEDVPAPDPSPPQQAIKQEEEAILWRSLARIPQKYRDPLILFYREHRSIENVAEALDLSEDAVKQRLLRGRALLHEEVLAFVEGTLERTGPTETFTYGVVAALPMLARRGSAATSAGMASTSATAGFIGAVTGVVGFLGGYLGWQMSSTSEHLPQERAWMGRFWRLAAISLVLCVLPGLIAAFWHESHPWIRDVLPIWLGAAYLAIGIGLVMYIGWHWRRVRVTRLLVMAKQSVTRRRALVGYTLATLIIGGALTYGFATNHWRNLSIGMLIGLLAAPVLVLWKLVRGRVRRRRVSFLETPSPEVDKQLIGWVGVATAGMAAVLVFCLADATWRHKRIATADARALITSRPDATYYASQYVNGTSALTILVPSEKGEMRFSAFLDEPTLAFLKQRGVAYRTLVEGRDFGIAGRAGRLLILAALLIVAAGSVFLARQLIAARRSRRRIPVTTVSSKRAVARWRYRDGRRQVLLEKVKRDRQGVYYRARVALPPGTAPSTRHDE